MASHAAHCQRRAELSSITGRCNRQAHLSFGTETCEIDQVLIRAGFERELCRRAGHIELADEFCASWPSHGRLFGTPRHVRAVHQANSDGNPTAVFTKLDRDGGQVLISADRQDLPGDPGACDSSGGSEPAQDQSYRFHGIPPNRRVRLGRIDDHSRARPASCRRRNCRITTSIGCPELSDASSTSRSTASAARACPSNSARSRSNTVSRSIAGSRVNSSAIARSSTSIRASISASVIPVSPSDSTVKLRAASSCVHEKNRA
jgi:hypothetical protein